MKKTRTDYKICPYCGASLDVGEICDCLRENSPQKRPRKRRKAQGNANTHLQAKAPHSGV